VILSAFTLFHVVLSLIGIVSGLCCDVRTAHFQAVSIAGQALSDDHGSDKRHGLFSSRFMASHQPMRSVLCR